MVFALCLLFHAANQLTLKQNIVSIFYPPPLLCSAPLLTAAGVDGCVRVCVRVQPVAPLTEECLIQR